MAELATLKSLIGAWRGTKSLWLVPGAPAQESPSTADVSTVAAGKTVTIDYTWAFESEAQDGRILIAINPTDGVHMAWCDSFHTDAGIMDLTGPAGGGIAATGSYAVPGGEPWGWRIEIETTRPDAFTLRMFNILPESMGGVEALAVEIPFSRT